MRLTNTGTINLAMQLDKKLNIIRDNEFDVGYSGVVNAHR